VAAVVVAPPPLLPLSTVVPVTSHSPRLPGLTPSLPLTPYHPLHSPLHGLTSSLLPILTVYYITTYLLLPIWSQPAIVGASITYLTLLSTIVLLPIMNTRYIVIYIYTLLELHCHSSRPHSHHASSLTTCYCIMFWVHDTSCAPYMVLYHVLFSTTIPALLYSVATSLSSLL